VPAVPPVDWDRLARRVALYSWAQVGFLMILVGSLHLFPLLGMPWSSCLVGATGATDWACVAFFHLYEIPFVALFVHHAYVGFTRMRRSPRTSLPAYTLLTLFQVIMLVVFLTFESKTLLDGLAQQVPLWEQVVVYGGCVGILVDALLGFHVVFACLVPAWIAERR
jgi:hypothetical protein